MDGRMAGQEGRRAAVRAGRRGGCTSQQHRWHGLARKTGTQAAGGAQMRCCSTRQTGKQMYRVEYTRLCRGAPAQLHTSTLQDSPVRKLRAFGDPTAYAPQAPAAVWLGGITQRLQVSPSKLHLCCSMLLPRCLPCSAAAERPHNQSLGPPSSGCTGSAAASAAAIAAVAGSPSLGCSAQNAQPACRRQSPGAQLRRGMLLPAGTAGPAYGRGPLRLICRWWGNAA